MDELRGTLRYSAFIPSLRYSASCASFLLQAEKVAPQIGVRQDAEKRFAEGDKNQHRKNRVQVEDADANPIIVAQLVKEGMAWIPKSAPVKILKNNYFARTGVWIALTV
jgi:hypothetical protein